MASDERQEQGTSEIPTAAPGDSEKPRGSERGPRREPRSPKH
jgi:hypothetical protein